MWYSNFQLHVSFRHGLAGCSFQSRGKCSLLIAILKYLRASYSLLVRINLMSSVNLFKSQEYSNISSKVACKLGVVHKCSLNTCTCTGMPKYTCTRTLSGAYHVCVDYNIPNA